DAAGRGLQQWFPYPLSCVGYMPLNTSRPTFADVNMRKAVNYAIDRTALSATVPPYQAPITDQYLPPGMPGFEDINSYPDHPDIGTRGEPFDTAVSVGWCEDWHDPGSFMQLFDGTTIHDGGNNINYAYFDDPVFNDRIHAADALIGVERYDAYRDIEHDLVRD